MATAEFVCSMFKYAVSAVLLLQLTCQIVSAAPAVSAAPDVSTISCNVTRLPNGIIRFQLDGPSSPGCITCWEDVNKTVIARGNRSVRTLVDDLQSDHIDLKVCQDYLRYWRDCPERKDEVACQVNCSRLESEELRPAVFFCLNERLCFNELTAGLVIGGLAVGLVLVSWLIYKYRSRIPGCGEAPYSGPEEIKLGGVSSSCKPGIPGDATGPHRKKKYVL